MDQIKIQTMTWHVSLYWLDTWHNINVTRGMNNLKKFKKILKYFKKNFKKNLKKKFKKKSKKK